MRPSTCNADIPLPSVKNGLVLTSDESEDEFCDSIGPEHLHELQNGNNIEDQDLNLDDTLEQKIDFMDGSNNCSGSPEHATNSTLTQLSENFDLENNVQGSQLLTSTPYSKHVTFAVESSDSDRPVVVSSDLSQVAFTVREECCSEITSTVENGQASQAEVAVTECDLPGLSSEGSQKPSGILKLHHPVRKCGGGDSSQHPSGKNHASQTWQTQATRNKEGRNITMKINLSILEPVLRSVVDSFKRKAGLNLPDLLPKFYQQSLS